MEILENINCDQLVQLFHKILFLKNPFIGFVAKYLCESFRSKEPKNEG